MSSVPIQRKETQSGELSMQRKFDCTRFEVTGADCASAPVVIPVMTNAERCKLVRAEKRAVKRLLKEVMRERDPYIRTWDEARFFSIRVCCSAFKTKKRGEDGEGN